ncbi:MAG: hypothetical protein ACR2NA_14490 [Solirubrobacterales bacterium]
MAGTWEIASGPEPGGHGVDGALWAWQLTRPGQPATTVHVMVPGALLHGPASAPRVRAALETHGRSEIEPLLTLEHPPRLVRPEAADEAPPLAA